MRWTGVKRGGTRSWWRVLATGGIFTSARPKLPERNGAVGGMLIDMLVTAQARIDIGTVERRLRREAVDTAAVHEEDQIDQHVAFGADFSFLARPAFEHGRASGRERGWHIGESYGAAVTLKDENTL